jgi:hypothetical protein
MLHFMHGRVARVCSLALTVAVFVSLTCPPNRAVADEGMWLFNDLPTQQLKERYGFQPTAEWAEHLMKSCVRFNVGGSASFISSTGLVLTNHHVGSDTLFKLSTPERNILEQGYLAADRADELKAPDLELNQLVRIRDVTSEIQSAVTDDMTTEEAVAARRAVIAAIESTATTESGLRSDVVTLYGGARYHLYQYKKYTDVRLVWAPETAAAFFGGDADNFEYPRYCLDACIFRVYENDQPAKIEHFLKWSENGAAEGEITFVAGNPGRTSRIYTTDALAYQRDTRLPATLNLLRRLEVLMQQYSLGGAEQERRARDNLFGIQNSRKARLGMLGGLQDPRVFAAKQEAEQQLLQQVRASAELRPLADAWEKIRQTTQERAALANEGVRIRSELFSIAQTLVQMAFEDQKPSGERLPRFADAGRESLLQQLYSDAPIYADLDQVLLADSIAYTLERRGADDPLCRQILNGVSPTDRAADLIQNTKLADVDVRKQLAAGGVDAISNSQDPLIQFALLVDPEIRRVTKLAEQLDEREKQAYARIAEAKFAIEGTSTYPDATFTLRLAFGPVKGYSLGGEEIPAWTRMAGAFEHEQQHAGQKDYKLPESWHKAKDSLNGNTPLNFVTTADIIGGNSGSPVVNRDLELVGLIFDGNIQSLTSDYVYSDTVSRAVSVHSSAIREALEVVYGADHIVSELGH